MFEIMLIESAIIIVLGLVCFISINSSIDKANDLRELKTDNQRLSKMLNLSAKTENKKTDIRNEYNEKENDIDNSNDIDNGIMPLKSRKHNHAYGEPCGKSCPAHSGS